MELKRQILYSTFLGFNFIFFYKDSVLFLLLYCFVRLKCSILFCNLQDCTIELKTTEGERVEKNTDLVRRTIELFVVSL